MVVKAERRRFQVITFNVVMFRWAYQAPEACDMMQGVNSGMIKQGLTGITVRHAVFTTEHISLWSPRETATSLELNDSCSTCLLQVKILQRRFGKCLLITFACRARNLSYLHQSDSRRTENTPEVSFRPTERGFSRWSTPRVSLSAVQRSRKPVPPAKCHQN